MERYFQRLIRQIAIFGEKGQRAIHNTKLCVVGSGGLGSIISLLAVLLGFKEIAEVDPDVMEWHNLNRHCLAIEKDCDSQREKVDVAKERLEAIDSGIRCFPHACNVMKPEGVEALLWADVVIGCVDNIEPRVFLNWFCTQYQKPYLDVGAGGRVMDGGLQALCSRASLYWPGEACQKCLWMDEDEPMEHSQVSLVTMNAVAASVGMEMLLCFLAGYGEKKNLAIYDSIKHELVTRYIGAQTGCPYCGKGSKR